MLTATQPWFVADRSEAFAGLLETSRDDIRAGSEEKWDDGAHFLVKTHGGAGYGPADRFP
jgi:hypothetical protein